MSRGGIGAHVLSSAASLLVHTLVGLPSSSSLKRLRLMIRPLLDRSSVLLIRSAPLGDVGAGEFAEQEGDADGLAEGDVSLVAVGSVRPPGFAAVDKRYQQQQRQPTSITRSV
jgi:hypothetical protein